MRSTLTTEALTRFGIACWEAGADYPAQWGFAGVVQCDLAQNLSQLCIALTATRSSPHGLRTVSTASYCTSAATARECLTTMRSTGADMVEIDDAVDLAVAKERIGERVALVGNVHTVIEFLQGTPESIVCGSPEVHRRRWRRRWIPARFGLHSAPLFAPRECQAMVDTAHSQPYPGHGDQNNSVCRAIH